MYHDKRGIEGLRKTTTKEEFVVCQRVTSWVAIVWQNVISEKLPNKADFDDGCNLFKCQRIALSYKTWGRRGYGAV